MSAKKEKPLKAKRFKATRKHHSREAAEDYTELIFDLTRSKGEARTGQIARHLGISHVTALRTMRRLQKEGYLETAPQKPIILTKKGRNVALLAKERHELLVEFLVLVGVSRPTAEIDAEGAEHHMSPPTLKAIATFMKKWGSKILGSA